MTGLGAPVEVIPQHPTQRKAVPAQDLSHTEDDTAHPGTRRKREAERRVTAKTALIACRNFRSRYNAQPVPRWSPEASWVRQSGSPSSRGLGHYPFTVGTGVRIPVGTPSFASTCLCKSPGQHPAKLCIPSECPASAAWFLVQARRVIAARFSRTYTAAINQSPAPALASMRAARTLDERKDGVRGLVAKDG